MNALAFETVRRVFGTYLGLTNRFVRPRHPDVRRPDIHAEIYQPKDETP